MPKASRKRINRAHCEVLESSETDSDFVIFGRFYAIVNGDGMMASEAAKRRKYTPVHMYACLTSGTSGGGGGDSGKLVHVPAHCLAANLTFMIERIPPNGTSVPVFGPFYFDSALFAMFECFIQRARLLLFHFWVST